MANPTIKLVNKKECQASKLKKNVSSKESPTKIIQNANLILSFSSFVNLIISI